jgi:hypothetical protein
MIFIHLSLLAGSFVAVLDSRKDRNDPAEIKSRIKRVSLVTVACVGYTFLAGYSLKEMGLSPDSFWNSIFISLGLSILLFLGPLATILADTISLQYDNIRAWYHRSWHYDPRAWYHDLRSWHYDLSDQDDLLITIRNLIFVIPILAHGRVL